jgi:hypothetical protein
LNEFLFKNRFIKITAGSLRALSQSETILANIQLSIT